MSNSNTDTRTATGSRPATSDRSVRRSTETKSALKTTEFFIYVLAVIAIIVTAAVVGDGEGQGNDLFGALPAMQLIVAVTIAYLVSRGLAKSGSREHFSE